MAKTQRSNLKNKRCWRGAQMSRVITPSTETTTSQSHNIQTQCRWYEQSWERRKERERMNRGQKRSRLWTTEAWGGNPQITKIIKKKRPTENVMKWAPEKCGVILLWSYFVLLMNYWCTRRVHIAASFKKSYRNITLCSHRSLRTLPTSVLSPTTS